MADEYASCSRESDETTDLYETTEGAVLAIVTDGRHEKLKEMEGRAEAIEGTEGAEGTEDTLVKEDTVSAMLSREIDEPYAAAL